MSAASRLRQGVRALLAYTQAVDYDLAACYLTPDQIALLGRLRLNEQLHSLNVLRAVLDQDDHTPHDLAVAALMHDVGKSRYALAVWQKSLTVLVRRFNSTLYERWSADETLTFWRAPYVVKRYHPAWGADMLAETGAAARAVWLVRHHDSDLAAWDGHPHQPLLARLQHADDAN